ncbi:unnamed protein product [Clonostachys chloroleuca]|uniref:Heterokaryon incompatibility domain-containing protein n=1 Tax=Clonostachys chloroleuca TaxID=1926264 RepID=A0AA35MHV7_9HYPO|nr:unnamed protein product [Clonostachys chloroleuca]
MASYPYSSLPPNTIRLLTIHPGSPHDPVSCGLDHADVRQPPKYEALSYCWGDPKDTTPITCDGIPFNVTKSLHSALVRLRLPIQPRIVWADAICINQGDTAERSAQVLLMQDIYRRASTVDVWLGGPIEVDGKDLWAIPHLLEAAQKNLKRTQLPIRHGTRDWVRFVLSNDWTTNGDLEDKRWNAIIKSLILMLQRPWFLRTWIIQEVALATHAVVLCGQHSASWDDFYRAVSYAIDLDYFSNTAPEMYSSLRSIEKARTDMVQGQTLRPLDMFTSFRIFLATDPRDKVFGVYSLFSESDLARVSLQPNYDMNVVEVFTRAALDCILSEGCLDVLSFAGCGQEESPLPSWVPDWTYRERSQPLLPRFILGGLFNHQGCPASWTSASGNSFPVVDVSEDLKILSLAGCIFDRIVETGGVLEKGYYEHQPGHANLEIASLMKEGSDVLIKWEEMCGIPDGRPYFTGETPREVYWRTLYAGCYPHGTEQLTRQAWEKWYKPLQDAAELTRYSGDGWTKIEESQSGTLYKIAAGAHWMGKLTYKAVKMSFTMRKEREQSRMSGVNRTVIRTENGYVGLAMGHVEEHDHIALLKGGKVPVVIRPGNDRTWTLVSDAYLHGIMNGELSNSLEYEMLRFS